MKTPYVMIGSKKIIKKISHKGCSECIFHNKNLSALTGCLVDHPDANIVTTLQLDTIGQCYDDNAMYVYAEST